MERVGIRTMTVDDVESVAAIASESPAAARWNTQDFWTIAEKKSPGVFAWVGELSGSVVGFIVLRAAGGEAEILNLAVMVGQRRQGFARQLITHALEETAKAGSARVFLEVRESNREAILLYTACGFEQLGRRSRYYSHPVEDALVLAKRT